MLGTGGPIEIDGSSPFAVGRDGSVTVNGSVAARLQIVDFPDPSRLAAPGRRAVVRADRGRRRNRSAQSRWKSCRASSRAATSIRCYTLVAMISAQRAFEIESRLMQATDENLDKAVNQLPAVR